MDQQQIINATQSWLTSFIIPYNICPFAKQVHEADSIRYRVLNSDKPEFCLAELIAECRHLDAEPATETTLLILAEACAQFDDFLDLTAIADQGYEGVYQLAGFHPDYCFAGEDESDPANYTNRSPYPMLHIIREASIEQALKTFPNPELIPERNIEFTRKLGLEKIQALFKSI
jgi:uncharacterized protein